nr:nuclear transport factor 2 family protein [Mycobacterium sp. 1245111.1]
MASHTMHRLTNQVVAVDRDKAESRTYVDALIMVDGDSGVNAAGFYDDQLVRGDDGWRVARRRFVQVRVAQIGDPVRRLQKGTVRGRWSPAHPMGWALRSPRDWLSGD